MAAAAQDGTGAPIKTRSLTWTRKHGYSVRSSPTFIPGLLQTAEYARARFAQSVTVFKVPNDIDEAVAARVRRQEMLYRPDKRFHFVLTEATLRYRLCAPAVMPGSWTGW